MCFVKKEENSTYLVYEPCQNFASCPNYTPHINTQPLPYYNPLFTQNQTLIQSNSIPNLLQNQLQAIINNLQRTNEAILSTLGILEQNDNHLTTALQDIKILEQASLGNSGPDQQKYAIPENELQPFRSNSSIIRKIFGNQDYKYKIKTLKDFPKVIYKGRNLLIPVQLNTKRGTLVRNANLIHLCLAVCDENGKWIVNQDEDYFIRGKVEVDLYRGESEFKKIYPKDITRNLPGGKINIIIYPRPSILAPPEILPKGERLINCSQIQPLIIHNVTVKSKKKSLHHSPSQ